MATATPYATLADLVLLALPLGALVGVDDVLASAAVVGQKYLVGTPLVVATATGALPSGLYRFAPELGAPVDLPGEALVTGLATVDNLLLAASRLADSYLGARFRLPLLAWGVDLRQVVSALAAFSIIARRGFPPETGDTISAAKRDAERWLRGVVSGEVKPVDLKDSAPEGLDTTVPTPDLPMAYQGSRPQESQGVLGRFTTRLAGYEDGEAFGPGGWTSRGF